MTTKENCELYLKYKYYYYCVGQPLVSDSAFDKFEAELRSTGDSLALKVVDLVDFPSIDVIEALGFNVDNIAPEAKSKRNETKMPHYSKMLSIQKVQCNDINNLPIHDVELFLNRQKSDYYEATLKYDGNSMNCIYRDGKLIDALTRGDGVVGLSKLNKMRLIVPNSINISGIVEVRGEVLIRKKLFREKYAKGEGFVQSERNWIAGVISKEDIDVKQFSDLTFVAYSLVRIIDGKEEYIDNAMEVLYENGFNKSYKPIVEKMYSIDDFETLHKRFLKYKEDSEFLIDGWVLKYPEKFRAKMGDNGHYWKWNLALKYESNTAIATISDIQWSLGKDGHLTPIAIFNPSVELDGVMVSKASLSNIGVLINQGATPGAIVKIKSAGEIIPAIIEIVMHSPSHSHYLEAFNNFVKNQK